MRGLALLFGLTGCQLVFPARDQEAVDAPSPVEDSDPSKPAPTLVVPEKATTGTDSALTLTVTGTAGAAVAYEVQLSDGTPETIPGKLDLDTSGSGSTLVSWTPGGFNRVTVNARVDYDPAFTAPANATEKSIAVFERFGDRQGAVVGLTQLPTNRIIAVPLALPGPARADELTIHVVAGTGTTTATLGLYEGSASPVDRIAVSVEMPLPNGASIFDAKVTPDHDLSADKNYWVAFVADKGVGLPKGAKDNGAPLVFEGTTLPMTLGAPTEEFASSVAVSVLVGPP